MRAEESAGARFTNNELSLLGLDHLRKLSRQLFEVRGIHAALGSIAEGSFEVRVAGGIDHRNVRVATGAEQFFDLWQRVPGYLTAAGGKFVDGIQDFHWFGAGKAGDNVDDEQRRIMAEILLALVAG